MNKVIIGVDEVGRGCLAGPVVAAAVSLPLATEHLWIKEIKDSKKLSAKKREALSNLITESSRWAIREASVEVIDQENILQATLLAMRESVEAVSYYTKIDMVLVDGKHTISRLDFPQTPVVDGDNLFPQIAAASIIAKVYRDSIMSALHEEYPQYGWDRNKGYGTEEHREAIMVYGTTPYHRTTFRGVAEYVKV